jgi:hypothetical protein
MIGGGVLGRNGCMLWRSECKRRERVFRKRILRVAEFEEFGIPYWRFEQFHKLSPAMWEKKDKQGSDEWWQGINMTDEFNKRCKKVISASREKVTDESMCALHPRAPKLGGWPRLSCVFQKP